MICVIRELPDPNTENLIQMFLVLIKLWFAALKILTSHHSPSQRLCLLGKTDILTTGAESFFDQEPEVFIDVCSSIFTSFAIVSPGHKM